MQGNHALFVEERDVAVGPAVKAAEGVAVEVDVVEEEQPRRVVAAFVGIAGLIEVVVFDERAVTDEIGLAVDAGGLGGGEKLLRGRSVARCAGSDIDAEEAGVEAEAGVPAVGPPREAAIEGGILLAVVGAVCFARIRAGTVVVVGVGIGVPGVKIGAQAVAGQVGQR